MNRVWLLVLALLIIGSIFKHAFNTVAAWIIIDLVVLFICYMILKAQPYINLRRNMIFLVGLTVVNITVALQVIPGFWGNIITLALLAWLIFGKQWPAGTGAGRGYPLVRRKYHK